MKNNISCLILAAGLSSRMGKCKSSLKWDSQRSFLQKIIEDYISFGCEDIIVVGNSTITPFRQAKFITNPHPEKERFFSIKMGMQQVKSPYCFLQPIDQPFTTQSLLKKLSCNIETYDYVVPCFEKRGGHPIFLGQKVINTISNSSDDSNLRIILRSFLRKNIAVNNDFVLRNIDTPQQYQQYFPDFKQPK
ncbi:NTP transferase domain-containing protein [Candidatus Uabimicrobium sp. HlEnr_7]|uniref:nucleotidyltransferase family protein n=1 Tax=Candidatus Uabimicrobium helgolandensis TaxID=3095367 RepID=UPI003558C74D